MADNMFKTGAVMDMVANAKLTNGVHSGYVDTQSIEDAAIKNKIINMAHKTRTVVREYKKIGRNDPCPCGATDKNGKPIKYKNCCLKTGKYENPHELTALETSKVKNNELNLSDISRIA